MGGADISTSALGSTSEGLRLVLFLGGGRISASSSGSDFGMARFLAHRLAESEGPLRGIEDVFGGLELFQSVL
jgi:hypothetical protein